METPVGCWVLEVCLKMKLLYILKASLGQQLHRRALLVVFVDRRYSHRSPDFIEEKSV